MSLLRTFLPVPSRLFAMYIAMAGFSMLHFQMRFREVNRLIQGCTAGTWESWDLNLCQCALVWFPHQSKSLIDQQILWTSASQPWWPFYGDSEKPEIQGDRWWSAGIRQNIKQGYPQNTFVWCFKHHTSGQALPSLRPWFWLQLHCRLTLVLGQMALLLGSQFPDL